MLLMLGKGPQAFSIQATLELPQLSAASCPDANAWMKSRTDHLLRYGEQLMSKFSLPGALYAQVTIVPDTSGRDIVKHDFDFWSNLNKESVCFAMADVSQPADQKFWTGCRFHT